MNFGFQLHLRSKLRTCCTGRIEHLRRLWICWWIPWLWQFRKIASEWKIPIWIVKLVPTDRSIYLILAAARILGQKALFCTCKLQLSAHRFLASPKVTCYLVQYHGMKSSGRWWSLSFHLALPYSNRKGHVITSMSWQRKFHIVSLRCDVTS